MAKLAKKVSEKITNEVMILNVTDLRKHASTLNVKNISRTKKVDLQKVCIELMITQASVQVGRKNAPKPGSKREMILKTLLEGITRYKTQAVCDCYWSEVQGVAKTYAHLIPEEIKASWKKNDDKKKKAISAKKADQKTEEIAQKIIKSENPQEAFIEEVANILK